MSLGKQKIVAFVPMKDPIRARDFYESKLGLRRVSDDPFAMVFDAAGIMLRVVKVGDFSPMPFTILGWQVSDIQAVARQLVSKNIQFERFDGFGQDEDCIWTSPGGSRVAWFKDLDGNVLSISQH